MWHIFENIPRKLGVGNDLVVHLVQGEHMGCFFFPCFLVILVALRHGHKQQALGLLAGSRGRGKQPMIPSPIMAQAPCRSRGPVMKRNIYYRPYCIWQKMNCQLRGVRGQNDPLVYMFAYFTSVKSASTTSSCEPFPAWALPSLAPAEAPGFSA